MSANYSHRYFDFSISSHFFLKYTFTLDSPLFTDFFFFHVCHLRIIKISWKNEFPYKIFPQASCLTLSVLKNMFSNVFFRFLSKLTLATKILKKIHKRVLMIMIFFKNFGVNLLRKIFEILDNGKKYFWKQAGLNNMRIGQFHMETHFLWYFDDLRVAHIKKKRIWYIKDALINLFYTTIFKCIWNRKKSKKYFKYEKSCWRIYIYIYIHFMYTFWKRLNNFFIYNRAI